MLTPELTRAEIESEITITQAELGTQIITEGQAAFRMKLCRMALAALEAAKQGEGWEGLPGYHPGCNYLASTVTGHCNKCGAYVPPTTEAQPPASQGGEALDLHELREAAGETGNGVCPHAYALCPHCQPPASQGVDLMTAWLQGYESGVHDAEHPTLQPAFNPYEDKAAPAPSVNKGE